jgi:hypothetical protein
MAARHERSPAALRLGLEREGSVTRVRIDKCRGAWPALVDIGESLHASYPSSDVVPLCEPAHAPDGATE